MGCPSMHGCGASKVMVRGGACYSVFRVWSLKPVLDTQELVREVNTAILSILGLPQGYIMTSKQQAMCGRQRDQEVVSGNVPTHAKETVKLLHKDENQNKTTDGHSSERRLSKLGHSRKFPKMGPCCISHILVL